MTAIESITLPYDLPTFAGVDAAHTADFGMQAYVGGVSACIHHSLTTNMPVWLDVFCADQATADAFLAHVADKDVLPNVRIPAFRHLDGVDAYICDGRMIWASCPARAVIEALAEDDTFDEDAKRETVRSYFGLGHPEHELHHYAGFFAMGEELARLLKVTR
jgi:hypothetical protein